MSRCFPFPPPGYEKARTDNADLLKKEKQKEKKHKKDKNEKEKREGKEKQDKDRSKEKHKDKKDRKEKHKDKDRDRDRDREKNRTSNEKKVEGQPGLSNGEKLGSNSLQNGDKDKNSLYVQELAKRIRDDDRVSGSQMVQKVVATDQTRDVVRTMVVERSISNHFEEKGKVNNRIEDYGKLNGRRNHIDTGGLEKAFGQNFSGLDKKFERVAAVKLEEKKDVEKQMEGKEKSKHKESDGKGDKLKDREQEKKKKSKDRDRSKEEKKKAKEIIEPSKEQPKLNENVSKAQEGGKDSLDFWNIRSSESLKLSTVSSAAEGNLGKRKEHGRNGYLLDNGSRTNKFPRNLSSSHPVVENGKKLEPCQTAVELTSEKGLANNHRVDIKDQKINGLMAAHPPIIRSARPSPAGISENGKTFSKLPHPDTRYLSQILSIPETEEWPDVNDQEWLFSSINSESKRPSVGSSWIEGTRQVWAEAFRIEYADISALPYVIPY